MYVFREGRLFVLVSMIDKDVGGILCRFKMDRIWEKLGEISLFAERVMPTIRTAHRARNGWIDAVVCVTSFWPMWFLYCLVLYCNNTVLLSATGFEKNGRRNLTLSVPVSLPWENVFSESMCRFAIPYSKEPICLFGRTSHLNVYLLLYFLLAIFEPLAILRYGQGVLNIIVALCTPLRSSGKSPPLRISRYWQRQTGTTPRSWWWNWKWKLRNARCLEGRVWVTLDVGRVRVKHIQSRWFITFQISFSW